MRLDAGSRRERRASPWSPLVSSALLILSSSPHWGGRMSCLWIPSIRRGIPARSKGSLSRPTVRRSPGIRRRPDHVVLGRRPGPSRRDPDLARCGVRRRRLLPGLRPRRQEAVYRRRTGDQGLGHQSRKPGPGSHTNPFGEPLAGFPSRSLRSLLNELGYIGSARSSRTRHIVSESPLATGEVA